REHDAVGALERLGDVRAGGHRGGELHLAEVLRIAVGLPDRAGRLLAARPEGDLAAGVGEDEREGAPPASGAEHRDAGHARTPRAVTAERPRGRTPAGRAGEEGSMAEL